MRFLRDIKRVLFLILILLMLLVLTPLYFVYVAIKEGVRRTFLFVADMIKIPFEGK